MPVGLTISPWGVEDAQNELSHMFSSAQAGQRTTTQRVSGAHGPTSISMSRASPNSAGPSRGKPRSCWANSASDAISEEADAVKETTSSAAQLSADVHRGRGSPNILGTGNSSLSTAAKRSSHGLGSDNQ